MTHGDRMVMWLTIPAGIALLGGTVAAQMLGTTLLPFDRHHFIGQIAGILLIFVGVSRWR
jgi:hypothetical protein